MSLKVPDYISCITPYVPGKPIEELEREYGIDNSIKLASNENPLGPSPLAVKAIKESMSKLHRYPDGSGFYLVEKLSQKLNIPRGNFVLGNGSDDIIGMLSRVFLQPGDEVIIPKPSFLMYKIAVQCTGAEGIYIPLKSLNIDLEGIKNAVTSMTRMIFICNPNNPTGKIISRENFEKFIKEIPQDIIIVIDEAYIEFVRDIECLQGIDFAETGRNPGKNIVTLRTFSKAYGLAGLRIGYCITSPEIANLLNRVRMPFNTSIPAQVGACAALDDEIFLNKTIETVHQGLDFLYKSLENMGLEFFKTHANFFLIDVKRDSKEIFEKMLRQGVIVRSMTSYGFPEYIRINVGTFEENQKFVKALKKALN
ncbi:histidinol-phosphate transaminase [Desulfobacterales bacterium HSG17]|nr:histidinol-phosphate transaminase [Desulfobacterales bacterium HSG17]